MPEEKSDSLIEREEPDAPNPQKRAEELEVKVEGAVSGGGVTF